MVAASPLPSGSDQLAHEAMPRPIVAGSYDTDQNLFTTQSGRILS